MKTSIVTLYTCDHCKKKLFRKHSMEKHEENCDENPKNKKACYGCIHFQDHNVEYYTWGYEEDQEHQSHCHRCAKFDKLMYSWKAEKRGLPEKYPETFEDQEPMPKDCRHFQEFPKDSNNDLLTDLPF